ncbi:MAG: hypothetical protein KME20_24095 [Kaiparowitsia implicata GSE-PSE-MK54-09C]|jgi:hypothetical protein|nr:hypothetical protein [Kaiparowitsia implicata GSE-PSE-MK54-09C]
MASLQILLAQFHSRHPTGCVLTDLATVHDQQYVVRAQVLVGAVALSTGMAAKPTVEAAEDHAKVRALDAFNALMHGANGATHYAPDATYAPEVTYAPTATDPNNWAQGERSRAIALPSSNPPNPVVSPASIAQGSFESDSVETAAPAAPSDSVPPSDRADAPSEPLPPREPDALTDGQTLPDEPDASPDAPIVADFYSHLASADPDEQNLSPTQSVEELTISANLKRASDLAPGSGKKTTAPPPPKEPAVADSSSTPALNAPEPEVPELTDASTQPTPPAAVVDLSTIIAETTVELKRLGWSNSKGREHLKRTYGKRSRQELDETELVEFLDFLKAEPSPERN